MISRPCIQGLASLLFPVLLLGTGATPSILAKFIRERIDLSRSEGATLAS